MLLCMLDECFCSSTFMDIHFLAKYYLAKKFITSFHSSNSLGPRFTHFIILSCSNSKFVYVKGHDFCAEGNICIDHSDCLNLDAGASCICKEGFRPLRPDNAYCEGKL